MSGPGGGRGEHRLGEALQAWLRSEGRQSLGALSAVHACWAEVVGPEVAAHVRPLALRGGALVVAVDHPAWATQVAFLGPQVLAALAARLGQPVAERLETTVRRSQGVE